MGLLFSKSSIETKRELWDSSLLSPLFVEDDLETLVKKSSCQIILPNRPLMSDRCQIALLYEGKVSAVIPEVGTVIFNIHQAKPKQNGLIRSFSNSAVSQFFSNLSLHSRGSNRGHEYTVNTEEMLISMQMDYEDTTKVNCILRFCITKTMAGKIVIKSYRATSVTVLECTKLVALYAEKGKGEIKRKWSRRHSQKPPQASVYQLLNNVLITDSITLLRSVPFLSEMANEKLLQLANLSTITVFPPKCIVFQENDEKGTEMFITLAGSLEVSKQQKDDQPPLVLATLGAGSCFGELALMTSVPRAATVRAIENAMLLSIERDHFLAFLAQNEDVKVKLTHLLQERLLKNVLSSNIVPFFQAIPYERMMALSSSFFVEDKFDVGEVVLTPETSQKKFCILICGSVESSSLASAGNDANAPVKTTLGPGTHTYYKMTSKHASSILIYCLCEDRCVFWHLWHVKL
jgi:hypothetical protein